MVRPLATGENHLIQWRSQNFSSGGKIKLKLLINIYNKINR